MSKRSLHPLLREQVLADARGSMERDVLLLREILDAAERIAELTTGRSAADLDGDRDRRDALLWNFTVLGEAVGQLSPKTTRLRPDRLWSNPVRTRNRIVHGYWSADLDVLVGAARDDPPGYIAEIRGVLADVTEERVLDVDHRRDAYRP